VLFDVSVLLNCVDVIKSFHHLVGLLIPSFHVFEHHQCHRVVFLEFNYPCCEKVPLIREFVVGILKFASQKYCGLCGVLIVSDEFIADECVRFLVPILP
jgi:hypothetical protein